MLTNAAYFIYATQTTYKPPYSNSKIPHRCVQRGRWWYQTPDTPYIILRQPNQTDPTRAALNRLAFFHRGIWRVSPPPSPSFLLGQAIKAPLPLLSLPFLINSKQCLLIPLSRTPSLLPPFERRRLMNLCKVPVLNDGRPTQITDCPDDTQFPKVRRKQKTKEKKRDPFLTQRQRGLPRHRQASPGFHSPLPGWKT